VKLVGCHIVPLLGVSINLVFHVRYAGCTFCIMLIQDQSDIQPSRFLLIKKTPDMLITKQYDFLLGIIHVCLHRCFK